MVEGYRRNKRKKKSLLGNHQKSWLWGRHVVIELLRVGKWPIHELYVSETLAAETRAEVNELTDGTDIPVKTVSADRIFRLCHSGEHQGLLARMGEFPYVDARSLIEQQTAQPLFLVLDRIQDPFNLGAMIRVADCLGVTGLFLPTTEQVGITTQVARSSAGGVNHLAIARVSELLELVAELKQTGSTIVAASEKAETSLAAGHYIDATTIIIGNEGSGISPELLAHCDLQVAIPQLGQVGSLNAAVATGIILYEVQRQRLAAAL